MKGVKNINKSFKDIQKYNDKESFEILHRKYKDHVYIFAMIKYKLLKYTHSYIEIQDIENDIWMHLWLYLRTNEVKITEEKEMISLIEKISDKVYSNLIY